MNIVITGGAGFLGQHLIKKLSELDHNITIFDNFSNSSKKKLEKTISSKIKIIDGDITKIEEIKRISGLQDIVIHLAAKISVSESIKNPQETFRINVEGTKNILNFCKNNNIKKIIVASTAAVYSDVGSSNMSLNENYPTEPISPYGKSKLEMEKTIEKICSKENINYNILRIFNMYGIGQSEEYAGVITKFSEKIKQKKPLIIFGDGLQTRDFISVLDVVGAFVKFLEYKQNGIFNIGSGKSITINNLASNMLKISKKNLEIFYDKPKKNEILYSQADISLVKKEIGFSPSEEMNDLLDFLSQ